MELEDFDQEVESKRKKRKGVKEKEPKLSKR